MEEKPSEALTENIRGGRGGGKGWLDEPGTVSVELRLEGEELVLVTKAPGPEPRREALIYTRDRDDFDEHFEPAGESIWKGRGIRLMTGGRFVQALPASESVDGSSCAAADQSRIVFYGGAAVDEMRVGWWNPAEIGICASHLKALGAESWKQPRWRLFAEILRTVALELEPPAAPAPAAQPLDLGRPFLSADGLPAAGFRPRPNGPHRVLFLNSDDLVKREAWGLDALIEGSTESDLLRFLRWWRDRKVPEIEVWAADGLRMAVDGAGHSDDGRAEVAFDFEGAWRTLGTASRVGLAELFDGNGDTARLRRSLRESGLGFLKKHRDATLWAAGGSGVFLGQPRQMWASLPPGCTSESVRELDVTGLIAAVEELRSIPGAFGRRCPSSDDRIECLRELAELFLEQKRTGTTAGGSFEIDFALFCTD